MGSEVKEINLKALFIGDKSENGYLYKDILSELIDEHLGWRHNYMPQDPPEITIEDQQSDSYRQTVTRMKNVLGEVSTRLRTHSVPWHTAGRYWGHMNAETLMPALLAYNFAMLWNGNNVAYESSPATSQMEEEVGSDFAKLMGFENGWGHIVADGSLANLEGLWYARNIKSLPLAMKDVIPEAVADKTDWQLMNLSMEEILGILKKFPDRIDDIKSKSARSGKNLQKLGKWLVPQTKHYSWMKAADIIGIGLDQVVQVPLNNKYRMDVVALENVIRDFAKKEIPILGVVAVVGSTEEGAIDEVDKIVALRKKLQKEGIYFYLHVDAAYGGYARSIVLDEDGSLIPYEKLTSWYTEHGVFTKADGMISRDVYNAFAAISEAESVTIDPHKMGYIPYSAGGIAIKDIFMREVISYFATYVFEKGAEIPALLGAYILEGSKAGATAASVWAAHHVLPLNVTGYGKLIGASIEGAHHFYDFLKGMSFTIGDKTVDVIPLIHPDFNMVDYVFKERGNQSLAAMNSLNSAFYKASSFTAGCLYDNGYITSHTDFSVADYGDSPIAFVHDELGFSMNEWNTTQKVTILRACVLTPYMGDQKEFDKFATQIQLIFQQRLEGILK
jgi:tyrosine decarboxylase